MQCPDLERLFPKLAIAGYQKTSEQTGIPPKPGAYNCIAWAAHDPHHGFWWPDPDHYWPFRRRTPTISCFVATFRWLGYRKCSDSRREFVFEKVALYAMHKSGKPASPPRALQDWRDWEPKHMARQLRDGTWTSKAGGAEDITHFTLDALESYGPRYGPDQKAEYGCPVMYMRRLIPISWIVRLLQLIKWKIEPLWKNL